MVNVSSGDPPIRENVPHRINIIYKLLSYKTAVFYTGYLGLLKNEVIQHWTTNSCMSNNKNDSKALKY